MPTYGVSVPQENKVIIWGPIWTVAICFRILLQHLSWCLINSELKASYQVSGFLKHFFAHTTHLQTHHLLFKSEIHIFSPVSKFSTICSCLNYVCNHKWLFLQSNISLPIRGYVLFSDLLYIWSHLCSSALSPGMITYHFLTYSFNHFRNLMRSYHVQDSVLDWE